MPMLLSSWLLKIKKTVQFLSQPYPFYYEGRDLWIIAGLIFFMTFIFTYFFEPFIVYKPEHRVDYFYICLIHSTTPVVTLYLWALFYKPQKRVSEKWNVGKEIFFVLMFFLLIGIGQFLIRDVIYDNPDNWSWHYLYEEIRNTFLVGTLFAAILIPLNLNYQFYKNQKRALALFPSSVSDKITVHSSSVFIKTQVKNDDFYLVPDDFIFAQSDGNYVEVYLNGDVIQKMVKRLTVKELEAQLLKYPFMMRTHRSYLINLKAVETITGNAQGYRLKIKNYDDTLPVSRYMISEFNKRFRLL